MFITSLKIKTREFKHVFTIGN